MKTKSTLSFLAAIIFISMNLPAQVINGGFEDWTNGNPDHWYTDNVTGIAIPVTQATPPYNGSYALKGEIINSVAGVMPPLVMSYDTSAFGFVVSQSYADFNFYYKLNVTGTDIWGVSVSMYDASGNLIGVGGQNYTGIVNTYTFATIPISYFGTNAAKCLIVFTLDDSLSLNPVVGDYFIVDSLTLNGIVGVEELNIPHLIIDKIHPNPASHMTGFRYTLTSESDVRISLYSVDGKKVQDLLIPCKSAGTHRADMDVSVIPAGFYILQLTASGAGGRHAVQSKVMVSK